jgi:hypothetical protein
MTQNSNELEELEATLMRTMVIAPRLLEIDHRTVVEVESMARVVRQAGCGRFYELRETRIQSGETSPHSKACGATEGTK